MTKWRGGEAAAYIAEDETYLGLLQEVEISVSKETSELMAAGSTFRQDVQQTEQAPEFSAEFMSWTPAGFRAVTGMTENGTTGTYELDDTYDVPQFDIVGEFTEVETGTTHTLTVKSVYLEDVPISGARDDWVSIDIEGAGKQLEFDDGSE